LAISAVKEQAIRLKLQSRKPDKIKNNDEFQAAAFALHPDAIIVVGYGRIIPQWMLDLRVLEISTCTPRCCRSTGARRRSMGNRPGRIRHRASTPWAIDAGVDTGDILMQREFLLHPTTPPDAGPETCHHGRRPHGRNTARTREGPDRPIPQGPFESDSAPISDQRKRWPHRLPAYGDEIHIAPRISALARRPTHCSAGRHLQVHRAHPLRKLLTWNPVKSRRVNGLLAGCGKETALELSSFSPKENAAYQPATSSTATIHNPARNWRIGFD